MAFSKSDQPAASNWGRTGTGPDRSHSFGSDDSALAVRAAADPAAFSELFDRYYAPVANYIRFRCDDDATAQDLAAVVFERLLHKISSYAPGKGPFGPWLFAVARNTVNDHWRRAIRRSWQSLEHAERKAGPEPWPEAALVRLE